MNVDIEIELNRLIYKYDIYRCNSKLNNYITARWLIQKLFSEFEMKDIVAIRGAGKHTLELMGCLPLEQKRKIDYIIDKNKVNYTYFEHSYKCIPEDDLKETKVSYVIISSFSYKEEMKRDIKKQNVEVKVIDLYEYFLLNGLKLEKVFYDKKFVTYEEIISVRKIYQNSSENNRALILERLIAYYINIRDFINAKKYIKEYIDSSYQRSMLYGEFIKELDSILDSIENSLRKRKQKDIIVNWIDALKPQEVDQMHYLSKIKSESINFENAYTVMPFTSTTFRTVISSKLIIDDEAYKIKSFTEEECKLVSYLNAKNYAFVPIGAFAKHNKELTRNSSVMVFIDDNYTTSMQEQWAALNVLLNTTESCLIMLHNLMETHEPYLSGELNEVEVVIPDSKQWKIRNQEGTDKKQYNLDVQVKKSRDYIDKQLEWFGKFYNPEVVQIFMSDHGKFAENIYDQDRIRVVFSVKGQELQKKNIREIFSLIDFVKIIKYIIEPNKYSLTECTNECARIQSIDAYSELVVKELLQGERDLYYYIQFKGVVTSFDKYIHYVTGEEFYFRLEHPDINQIDKPEYKERIEKLKKMAGSKYIDIEKDDFFANSREIYDKLGLKRIILEEK